MSKMDIACMVVGVIVGAMAIFLILLQWEVCEVIMGWMFVVMCAAFIVIHIVDEWIRKRKRCVGIDDGKALKMEEMVQLLEWEAMAGKFEHQWDKKDRFGKCIEMYECKACKWMVSDAPGSIENRKKHKCNERS